MKNDERRIGLLGAVAIGVGAMVGGGIFAVLGEAVSMAHGGTPIAFLVAGILALLTAHSYAKLAVKYPSEGGTVIYLERAFGLGLITRGLNMLLWLSYLISLSLYAVAFGAYGATFLPGDDGQNYRHLLICLAIIVPVAINLFSSELVSKSETFIVIAKIVLLCAIVLVSFDHVDTARFAIAASDSPLTIISAGMIVFITFEGFELIGNASQDVKQPDVTLPRAFYIAVIAVLVLYVGISMITVGTLSESEIKNAKDFALAEAARPALGEFGFKLVAAAALLATFSAINATLYGNARLGFMLAKERELPKALEKKIWNDSYLGILIVGFITLVMANAIDLTAISIIGSAGFLLIFAAVNLAAFRLSQEIGCNRFIAIIAFVFSLAALVILFVTTWNTSPHALAIFAAFVGFSLIFEAVYGRLVTNS
ncbi:amino acid permease [Vibrio sp. SM6]|uniref:Amino acid permease n=1 Tax=Vibrio agarilyticus TaxID=2726741 RepID=A0A7X8TQ73_9VIBR|nr:APC family permease [Vibrio agarilyticus]NLS12602.1 amino acid permease [Vibrio agarilyticus]